MPGRQGDPWVRGVGAFRVLMYPGLGWPLGPFVVVFTPQGVNEDTLDDVGWTLFGDADPPVSIKSEAWVVLDARDRDSEPGLVELTLEDFDEPPEVAVVRHIGDQRLGLATLRREPYRLIAPAITTIRIRGQCRVASIRISSVFPDVTLDSFVVLSAPVGRINGRYFGIDPDETAAMDRVANGAPLAFGPHESEPSPATDRDAEIAEQKRVDALAGWLRRALRAALAAPIGGHGAMSPLSSIHGHPTVTRAEFQDQMATLVAGGDLGIARWLGLADQLPDLGGNTMLVTTMGVWALSSAHPLARHASAISERGLVHSFFDSSGLEQVTKRADEMRASGLEPLWLYSQAWVDLDVAPDPPLPPTVQVRKPPLWIRGTTEDADVGMLPVETYGVAMLGQVGLERRDPDPAPLHEFIEGTARLRSQLAVEGPAVTDRIAAPFGSRKYRGWQSDAFGRWSKDFDELPVPAFDRVPLAQPDPMVRLGNSAPSGDGLWTPVLLVRVGIPPRAGGQREIVSVLAETAVDTHLLSGLGQEFVDFQIAGPSLGPGDTTPATVTVTFRARADIEVSSATRSIDLIDPRPPPPPTPP